LEEKKGIFGFLKIDKLANNLIKFIESRVELLKLEIREEAAEKGARLLILSIFVVLFLFFMLFLSFFLSDYLNQILKSSFWGYGIVSGFYLLLIILLASIRRPFNLKERIRKNITNYLRSRE